MAAERDSERVACDIAVTDPYPRPPGGRGRYHCDADGPDTTSPRLAWSPDRRKWFGMDLAAQRIFHIGSAMKGANGPIAQLDRVTDFYSVGCRFESCWDRQPSGSLVPRPDWQSEPSRPQRVSAPDRMQRPSKPRSLGHDGLGIVT